VCDINNITSSGTIKVSGKDASTSAVGENAQTYTIDTQKPQITITAPTLLKNSSITDTTIKVIDNNGIKANKVTVDNSSTVNTSSFSCTQTNDSQVDCTISIDGPSNTTAKKLVIKAEDVVGNDDTAEKDGYIIDTEKPVITLIGLSPVNLNIGDTYTDDGATANDNIDGDITVNITMINPVDTNIAGMYTITYNVDDLVGNTAVEVTRTVIVSVKKSLGKSGPARSMKRVCRDKRATNYNRNGFHTQALCEYVKDVSLIDKIKKQIEELKKELKEKENKSENTLNQTDCPHFTSYYKKGDKNQGELKKIQIFLRDQGFFKHPYITGFYGPVTDKAIKDFQAAYADEILKP
jgi:hypothetical protein